MFRGLTLDSEDLSTVNQLPLSTTRSLACKPDLIAQLHYVSYRSRAQANTFAFLS